MIVAGFAWANHDGVMVRLHKCIINIWFYYIFSRAINGGPNAATSHPALAATATMCPARCAFAMASRRCAMSRLRLARHRYQPTASPHREYDINGVGKNYCSSNAYDLSTTRNPKGFCKRKRNPEVLLPSHAAAARYPIETPCFWQRRTHVQGFFAGTPFIALPHRQPTRHAYRPAAD